MYEAAFRSFCVGKMENIQGQKSPPRKTKRVFPNWEVENAIGSNRDAFNIEGDKKKSQKESGNFKKIRRKTEERSVGFRIEILIAAKSALCSKSVRYQHSVVERRSFLSVKGIHRRQKRPLRPLKASKRLPLTFNPARRSALSR